MEIGEKLSLASPRVSVCIPTYKKPELLERCVSSVLAQKFQDFEILITDDTPDSSVEESIRSLLKSDERVRFHRNLVRQGSPGNWNTGLRLAKGAYIKVLHHDDWLLTPDSLGLLVDVLDSRPEVGLVFGSSEDYDHFGVLKSVNSPSLDRVEALSVDPSAVLFANFVGAPSATLFRRVPGLLFDDYFVWLVDAEFYFRYVSSTRCAVAFATSSRIGISVEDGRVTNDCIADSDLILRETLALFRKCAVPEEDRRVRSFLRTFSYKNLASLRFAEEYPRLFPRMLSGYLKARGKRLIYLAGRALRKIIR